MTCGHVLRIGVPLAQCAGRSSRALHYAWTHALITSSSSARSTHADAQRAWRAVASRAFAARPFDVCDPATLSVAPEVGRLSLKVFCVIRVLELHAMTLLVSYALLIWCMRANLGRRYAFSWQICQRTPSASLAACRCVSTGLAALAWLQHLAVPFRVVTCDHDVSVG